MCVREREGGREGGRERERERERERMAQMSIPDQTEISFVANELFIRSRKYDTVFSP